MAKVTRATMSIFGLTAGANQMAQFGSLAAGAPLQYTGATITPAIVQALSQYASGWYAAVQGQNSPTIQDMNALCYLLSYQCAYLLEMGIPEYDSGTTYYTNSVVQSGGVVYIATGNAFVGQAPPNLTYWVVLLPANPTSATRQFLSSTGTGSVAGSSAFAVIAPSDVPVGASQNVVLNSDMGLWQRGTSTTIANTVTTYQADRFYGKNILGTNGVLTYSQVAAVTAGSQFGLSLKITTAPTAAQVNGCELYYALENKDSVQFYNQSASMSVLVKALGNVNQVGLQFYYKTTEAKVDTGIGAETTFTVNSSTFTLGSIVNQALGTAQTAAGIVGFRIRITGVSSGNTYDLNNGFVVEQVQMNLGSTVGAWRRANPLIAEEILACQRYYEKSFDLAVAPGAASSNIVLAFTSGGSLTAAAAYIAFKAIKRTSPTVTTYNSSSGATGTWHDSGAADKAVTIANTGTVGTSFTMAVTSGGTISGHWTADAEI